MLSLFFLVLGHMLVVVLSPLCPVRFSLLLYCIHFCFSVPNKTITISISISIKKFPTKVHFGFFINEILTVTCNDMISTRTTVTNIL